MAFWRDALAAEPKRKHRFIVQFVNYAGGGQVQSYYAAKIGKPEITVNTTEHKYLGHTYKFPGNLTWNEIEAEFVDVDRSALSFLERLQSSGYNPPLDELHTTTISKDKAVGSVGVVQIISLGANTKLYVPGQSPVPAEPPEGGTARYIDSWSLKNAWISKLGFGEADYDADDILRISVTFVYDWARYENFEYNKIVWP
jgi:hypothetical protein